MAEIRQIQVDGVNYDLVISEDEVSATRAEQAAQRAANSATHAASNSAQASEYSVTAGEYAQDAQDAADRAEAIVGGQFVSYGQSQSLTDSEKETARTNIGVTKHSNANLLDNWYWVGGGTAGKFPINQRGKTYYAINDYTIDRWKSVNLYTNGKTVKVATQDGGLVLAGDTGSQDSYVQFQQIIQNPPYGKEVTLSVLVDNLGADDDGNYPQIWYGVSAYKNITTTGLTSVTFTCPTDTNENYVRFVLYDGSTQASSIRIQAVKLELGAVSTLEQDVAPDYGTELTRCLYSNVDSVDTYGNSGYGRTNPNILMNWDFTNPVNSRGKTTYTEGGYRIDKWRVWNEGTTTTLTTDGLVLSNSTTGDGLFQYLDSKTFTNLYGKTVTVSAIINGRLITATGIASADCWIAYVWTDVVELNYICTGTEAFVRMQISGNSSITIKSVKLEIGSVSTLSYDSVADYGTELARCIYSSNLTGDTYAGNGFGRSNRNLLDNAYFVGGGSQLGDGIFPINQRGQTSYSTGTNTTIDRWKTEASSISVDADGLTWTATGDNNQFEQIIENYKLIEGETYTATIDCDISAGSARLFVGGVSSPWPTVAGSAVNVSSGITKVTFTFTRESGYTGQYKLALASVGSCTAKLRKFKLEKGTVSTLANDPPPDFGEELRKCKWYLRDVSMKRLIVSLNSGYSVANATLTGVEMRSQPTPSIITSGLVIDPNTGTTSTFTSVSVIGFEDNTPTIELALSTALSGTGVVYDTVVRLSCEL